MWQTVCEACSSVTDSVRHVLVGLFLLPVQHPGGQHVPGYQPQ